MGNTRMLKKQAPVDQRDSVRFTNEGQTLFGTLHRPLGLPLVPAVLFCHGLAGVKTGASRAYVILSTMLAQAGIASFRFDCRGSGDSEGDFQDITLDGIYSDCLEALKVLQNFPGIDRKRIGIFGRSFGGVLAVMTALRSHDIKSMALWCPMFSGKQWIDQWQIVQSGTVDEHVAREMMRIDGQQGSAEFFDEFFAIDLSDEFQHLSHIPLLHIHGENDKRVHLSHADDYARFRADAAADTCFIRLANSDHDFSHFEEKQKAFEETVSWFKKTL